MVTGERRGTGGRGRVLRIAAAVVATMVGAACGDDDGGSAITRAEFIEAADAICADFEERFDALGEELAADATFEDVARLFLDEGLPLFREQIEELRALEAPEADAEELARLWDDLEEATEELEQAIEEDPQGTLSGELDPFAEQKATAQEYGFEECGSD